MMRLTKKAVMEKLVVEYIHLEQRMNDLLGDVKRMEESENPNESEIRLSEQLAADKIIEQCEVVRVWGSLFDKDFKTSLDEIIDYSRKFSQKVSA